MTTIPACASCGANNWHPTEKGFIVCKECGKRYRAKQPDVMTPEMRTAADQVLEEVRRTRRDYVPYLTEAERLAQELGPLTRAEKAQAKRSIARQKKTVRGMANLFLHAGVARESLGDLARFLDDDTVL